MPGDVIFQNGWLRVVQGVLKASQLHELLIVCQDRLGFCLQDGHCCAFGHVSSEFSSFGKCGEKSNRGHGTLPGPSECVGIDPQCTHLLSQGFSSGETQVSMCV